MSCHTSRGASFCHSWWDQHWNTNNADFKVNNRQFDVGNGCHTTQANPKQQNHDPFKAEGPSVLKLHHWKQSNSSPVLRRNILFVKWQNNGSGDGSGEINCTDNSRQHQYLYALLSPLLLRAAYQAFFDFCLFGSDDSWVLIQKARVGIRKSGMCFKACEFLCDDPPFHSLQNITNWPIYY